MFHFLGASRYGRRVPELALARRDAVIVEISGDGGEGLRAGGTGGIDVAGDGAGMNFGACCT